MVGNPSQKPRSVPIPVLEKPFSELLIDIVGHLPKTSSGFSYILALMDTATFVPEAVSEIIHVKSCLSSVAEILHTG